MINRSNGRQPDWTIRVHVFRTVDLVYELLSFTRSVSTFNNASRDLFELIGAAEGSSAAILPSVYPS